MQSQAGAIGSDRPGGADECGCVNETNYREPYGQADVVRYRSYEQGQNNLQECAGKIKRVLHAAHKMRRNLFHDAGVHRYAADTPTRPHNGVEQNGDR